MLYRHGLTKSHYAELSDILIGIMIHSTNLTCFSC